MVFPEATMRRFGLPLAEIAEPVDGPWAQRLRKIAEHHQLVIVAGMFTPSGDGRVKNTLRAVGPDVDAHYDKIHLFDAFGFRESDTVAAGAEPVMITVGDAKVGLTTCYDVRFPGLYLKLAELGRASDLRGGVLGSGRRQDRTMAAAHPRSRPGQHLVCDRCRVRPIQQRRDRDQALDVDDNAPTGVGYSVAVSPSGEVLESLDAAPGLLVADLDLDVVEQTRAAIPVLANRRF